MLNLDGGALFNASALPPSSPEQLAGKNTPARAQREQDADAQIHKTPAQVEGSPRAAVALGEHDDAAGKPAEAHARADEAAAWGLKAPANAAQETNLSKPAALAADRRQLSTYTEFPVGLFSTQIEAASWPNEYTFVTESDCFIAALLRFGLEWNKDLCGDQSEGPDAQQRPHHKWNGFRQSTTRGTIGNG